MNFQTDLSTSSSKMTVDDIPSIQFNPLESEFSTQSAMMRLDQFGIIEVSGIDAITFLHNQLTSDIESLNFDSSLVTGYCSPKGRLIATFLLWRVGHTVRLLVSRDIQAIVQERLSIFILRSSTMISNASTKLVVIGFVGNVCDILLRLFGSLPNHVHEKVDCTTPPSSLIRMPDSVGRKRYLWIGERSYIDAYINKLNNTLPIVSRCIWDWLDIRSGEARVTRQTIGQFIPQMINFDVIGAISFDKGCYPGQEIIIRSQHRGTIKRRAVIANIKHFASNISGCDHGFNGTELFHSNNSDQPCGMIINATAIPKDGIDALVSIKLTALENGSVHIGSIIGPTLTFESLPYTFMRK